MRMPFLQCVVIVGGMKNMIDLEKPSLEELAHYGVKGMHWGHHKRPETVEIADARAAEQKEKVKFNQAKKVYKRQTTYGLLGATEKEQKAFDVATREYIYTKEDLGRAKILNKLKAKPKSEEQLKLEAKYKKEKKMTDDEAAVAAYQHIRTKKMLLVVGGVAVTAAVAYGAYKFHDNRVDKIIKSGTLLQHMSADSTKGVRDAFYSANHEMDKVKYRGMFGQHLKMTYGGAYKKDIKVLSDIRQASPMNAQKILSELIKNDPEVHAEFKKYLVDSAPGLGGVYRRKAASASASLASGKVDKNVYEVFNAALVDHSPQMEALSGKFYNLLSEKGYNAIRDVNDVKYSGYMAVNPIIAFKTTGKVNVVDVAELTDKQMRKEGARAIGQVVGTTFAKQMSVVVAAGLAGEFGKKVIKSSSDQKAIDKYRKENPNTTMTNTEIIRMIERSK